MKGPVAIWLFASLYAMTLAAAPTDQRLVDAVKNSDRAAIQTLLDENVDVNATQSDGATALAWAVYWNDLDIADTLIRAGADPNLVNDYGVSPLMLACTNNNVPMVRKLLEARADANKAQWMGVTPLIFCARSGSVEGARLLLTHGADPNASDSRRGQTALMWAASRQHPEVVSLLTEHGADVNAKTQMPDDFKQLEFISYGVQSRDPTKPDIIRENDVHPDPTSSRGGFTALMFAARKGNLDIARVLVTAGAEVNDYSPEYGSSLVVAAANGHLQFALYLLEQGAVPNVADRWGFTPLHYSLWSGIVAIGMSRERIPSDEYWLRESIPELVKSLLVHGADPNARVGDGFPPFNYHRFDRTIAGDMPQLRQPGATAFLLAAASFDTNLMTLLVSHGADPKLATNEGITPLMVAAGMGRVEDISEDEQKEALEATILAWELSNDVNATNQDGRTALAAAAYLGANSIIQFLVDKGADIEAKDRYEQTALSIAQGVPYKINGSDKRFLNPTAHKSSEELLLSLGANR